MAGPTASILFVSRATQPLAIARSAMLATGDVVERGEGLWLDERPFLVSTGPEYPESLAELVASGLPRLLGWTPTAVVSFAAMCNDARDHRLLARLCLAVCEATGGIVDFGGPLPCGPQREAGSPGAARRIASPEGLDGALFAVSYPIAAGESERRRPRHRVSETSTDSPGRSPDRGSNGAIGRGSRRDSGRRSEAIRDEFGTTHLGDTDLLRAWLAHPDFRMVK